jgi:NADH-quinone oxidoreductase subunit L
VIHAMSDEQDIRKMGGIWKKIPATYAVMWIGSLALSGIPPFAGFYSKDAVLEAAYAAHTGVGLYGFACGIIAAFLTSFYSWRLLILTFHGAPRADHHVMAHVHESPLVMLLPLFLLAAGALASGFLLEPWFIGHEWKEFWGTSIVNGAANHVLEAMHHVPRWVGVAPIVVCTSGVVLAYILYMLLPSVPPLIAARCGFLYRFLLNKWYFDELYDAIFVKPAFGLARLFWQVGDATLIDGLPNGAASLAAGSSRQIVKIQTGSIAIYAFSMLIGVVALVSIFLVFR